MNINEAFKILLEDEEFKEFARKKDSYGAKLRVHKSRFLRHNLDYNAIVNTMSEFGYEVDVQVRKVDCHYTKRK